jgi:hypothetical protein
MTSIRNLSAGFLFLLFVLNLYLGIIANPDPGFIKYIVFGAVYFALGILLISKFRFAELLGFIIALAILFIYPLLVDFKNMNVWSSGVLGGIDAIVVICCFILLLLKL